MADPRIERCHILITVVRVTAGSGPTHSWWNKPWRERLCGGQPAYHSIPITTRGNAVWL